jgi:hypothetical protein
MSYAAANLTVEQRLTRDALVFRVGDPGSSYGKLSDAIGKLEKVKVRVLAPCRLYGIEAEPGQVFTLESDVAKGLRVTGHVVFED